MSEPTEFAAHAELPDDLGPWCIVANIVKHERGGEDPTKRYRGTRVFAPGAKVYVSCADGGAYAHFGVIGLNRVSKKLSVCMVHIDLLENLRSKVIYDRKVLQTLLWTHPMAHRRDESIIERNFGAGHICLLKTEAACEDMRTILLAQQDRRQSVRPDAD